MEIERCFRLCHRVWFGALIYYTFGVGCFCSSFLKDGRILGGWNSWLTSWVCGKVSREI
ncbi:hypothetical protein BDV32DRAFT_131209, partial [Aspergillus pseudonomiae]